VQNESAGHEADRRYGQILILVAGSGLIALLLMTALKRIRLTRAETTDEQAQGQGVAKETHHPYKELSQESHQAWLGLPKETHHYYMRLGQNSHFPNLLRSQNEAGKTHHLYPSLSPGTPSHPYRGMSQDMSQLYVGQEEEIDHVEEESDHIYFEDELADLYKNNLGLAQKKEVANFFPGPLTEDEKAISDFTSGLRDSYPIQESSSDLLLLRVDTDLADEDLVSTKQRRHSVWNSGSTHSNVYEVFTKVSTLFKNVFGDQNYIEVY
jgi:hypothetical protein